MIRYAEEQFRSVVSNARDLFASRYGLWFVAMVSFVESALPVPIITDPFMIGYILLRRAQAVQAVVVTTVSSVAGGIVAYVLATSLYTLILPYLGPESVAELESISARFKDGTFLITLIGAITPVPYTFVALGAGFMKGGLLTFIVASIIGRGIRYTISGYATYRYGPQAIVHIKQHIRLASILGFILLSAYMFHKFW